MTAPSMSTSESSSSITKSSSRYARSQLNFALANHFIEVNVFVKPRQHHSEAAITGGWVPAYVIEPKDGFWHCGRSDSSASGEGA